MNQFVHLHVHTEYSLLDGAARIKQIFEACKKKNMPAIAITDHGVLYGVLDFVRTAKAAGIKPIVGCEFYVVNNMYEKKGKMNGEYNHLILLAKNEKGYKNLIKLDSIAFVDGFYYKPRIDLNLLKKHSEGLICLSACIQGSVPQAIINGNYELAVERAKELKSYFDKGDFYIEIQDHGLSEEKIANPLLVKLARELDIKIVATNDVHYIEQEDAEMHDVLLCVQTAKTLDDPNRMRFNAPSYYLKDYEEMNELFSWCPEALTNQLEIVNKCNVDITEKQDLMPGYIPDNGQAPFDFLKLLTEEGLRNKYPIITDEIRKRADYELNIINSMHYVEYFLIVWDFIHYATSHDIPVGPGRGSGVGSIVAYASGITDVDPLKYSLIFERFLNPERVSMPDFDIDFCCERRGEVINYVIDKYGASKVAQIITFGTMKVKNAIRDVARVYSVPYSEADRITKLIPNGLNVSIASVLGELDKKGSDSKQIVQELRELYDEDVMVKRILDMARKIENMPRNTSKHAAGVVICKYDISDYVPLQRNGEDITIQFNMIEAEKLGLLKMDFLGLITLTDIKKAKQYVLETTGNIVDFATLGYEDKAVYDLIGSGDTDAIFQLESPGMKRFMTELRPNSMEDVIAGISLYRPGPMDSIPKYIGFKQHPETIKYDHELLRPILGTTYGCIVYQEQVMEIVRSLGGYSLGRADNVRRLMSKKKVAEMAKEEAVFINGLVDDKGNVIVDGALRRGVPQDVAEKVYADMATFASYAFNKSHAAAYAVLAYQTAYLKKYYPVEFIAAVVNNRITKSEEVSKYIMYMREHNIGVLQPDINKSNVRFSVQNGCVRFGLSGLKGVGEGVVLSILEERDLNGDFKNLEDLFMRCSHININKRVIESMIKGGAFDCFGINRACLMNSYETVLGLANADKKIKSSGQFSLFDEILEDDFANFKYPEMPEYEERFKLQLEKEVLGAYVSGHPLDAYKEEYKNFNFNTSMLVGLESEEEAEMVVDIGIKDKMIVITGGILNNITKKITKMGKEMAFAKLEDFYGNIELMFPPAIYQRCKSQLIEDSVVKISGELQLEESNRAKIIVKDIKEWQIEKESLENKANIENVSKILYVKIDKESEYDELMDIFDANPGHSKVRIQMNGVLLKCPKKVSCDNALICELYGCLGEDSIKIK